MAEQVSAWSRRDEELCAEGVALANLPTLLMVLVQLTGELRWLEDPYRPRRAWGMGDNDTGRLPEPVQAEIREAALEAILAWRRGRPAAIPEPSPELRVQMLSCAMGEEIPKEYAPLIAAQLGFETLGSDEEIAVPDGFSVLIIGAGGNDRAAASGRPQSISCGLVQAQAIEIKEKQHGHFSFIYRQRWAVSY